MEKRLSEDLIDLRKMNEVSATDLTLGHFLEVLSGKGFGVLLTLLALPSALPVPAPGYSTPFGLLLVFFACQMLIGKRSPWVPTFVSERRLSRKMAETMLRGGSLFFDKTEWLIHPRLTWLTGRVGFVLAACVVLVMAGLMILPIPLTNTAPAAVIFLIGVALSEKDGLLFSLFLGLGVAVAALYAYAFSLIFYFGASGLEEAFKRIF